MDISARIYSSWLKDLVLEGAHCSGWSTCPLVNKCHTHKELEDTQKLIPYDLRNLFLFDDRYNFKGPIGKAETSFTMFWKRSTVVVMGMVYRILLIDVKVITPTPHDNYWSICYLPGYVVCSVYDDFSTKTIVVISQGVCYSTQTDQISAFRGRG